MSTQRSDTARLRWLMKQFNVKGDRYDYAMMVAAEEGHDEPTEQDEFEGFRRMIDCAMDGGDR